MSYRDSDPIAPGQLRALRHGLQADGHELRWIVRHILDRLYDVDASLTVGQWRAIRDRAWPHWPDDDWTMRRAFASDLALARREYAETVLGQRSLF